MAIQHDPDTMLQVVGRFSEIDSESAREYFNLGPDTSGWSIDNAKLDLQKTGIKQENVVPILYRPFDFRWTYFTAKSSGFLGRPRAEIMYHFNIPLLINGFGRGGLEEVRFIRENDIIEIGAERLHVIETPGHTTNDIMLIDYNNMLVFTGDTLLKGRLPRQLQNYNKLMTSIRKILNYPKITDNFKIYPGHGSHSTIGDEKLRYY